MKYYVALSIALVISFALSPALGQEKSFMGKLREQERKEYDELVDSIKKMPDAEYKIYLNERLDKSYEQSDKPVSALIVVDVTEEINQPEPGFFQRLLTNTPEPEDYGIDRIQTMLSESSTQERRSVGGATQFVFEHQHQSLDKQRTFQQVKGRLDKDAAKLLITQANIVDLHVKKNEVDNGTFFVMTHTPTGRVLPQQEDKHYSKEFLHDGLYQDLMKKFEHSETTLVAVSFPRPDNIEDYPSQEEIVRLNEAMDSFIDSWDDYEFKVFLKSRYYVLLDTTKPHVEAMKNDSRIRLIREGPSYLMPAIRPQVKP